MKKLLLVICLTLSASIHSMEIDQDLIDKEYTRLITNLSEICRHLARSSNIQENLALIDFEQSRRNSQHTISSDSLAILKKHHIIQQDDTIHPAIKAIIKSKEEKKS